MGFIEGRKVKSGTTWRFVYRDKSGVQQKVKIGITSKRVAEQRKSQFEAMLAMGKDPKEELQLQGSTKLSQLMEIDAKWASNRLQPRTIELNREIMKSLVEWAGDLELHKVDRSKAEKYLEHCSTVKSYKSTTLNMHRRQLASIFQRAIVEHGLLRDNPWRGIKKYQVNTSSDRVQFLELPQIDALLGITSNDINFQRLIRFYLLTGARRNEALELKWVEVDFEREVLYLGQPRSQTKLRRDFPILPPLKSLLLELLPDANGHATVFWRFEDQGRTVSSRFNELKKKYSDLPDSLTTHLLRHTFASHLVMEGVDMRTVASLMGHRTTTITELYSHLAQSHREKALERLPYGNNMGTFTAD
ncbi:tyrosine-type recombinase/integrase [bacterium]|nr:tyrosine-type recombinase/integrase [bacterium]